MDDKDIAKNINADDQLQSGVFDETEHKKEHIEHALHRPNVVDTMEFYLANKNFEKQIQDALRKLNPISLKDAKILDIEQPNKNGKFPMLSSYKGIDIALEKIIENYDAKIILASFYPLDYFFKNEIIGDKLKLLFSRPNVKFVQLPFLVQQLIDLFKPQETKEDILKTISFDMGIATTKEMEDEMREELKKIDSTGLKDTIFIRLIGTQHKDQKLQELHGLTRALDELKKNPEQKIVIITPSDMDHTEKMAKIAHKSDEFTLVCSGKNVRFFAHGEDLEHLEHIFDQKGQEKNTLETNESILNTLQFYDVHGRYPYLKDFFASLDLIKYNFKNSIIVDLRADEDTARSDMSGLRIAGETLQKDPNAKIILCSVIPVEIFTKVIAGTKSEEYLKTLLQGKNVRIIQSSGGNSMTEEEVYKQFDDMYKDSTTAEPGDASETFRTLAIKESETAFQKVLEREISHFIHDADYRVPREEIKNVNYEDRLEYFFNQPREKKSDERKAFEARMIALLQFQHPSYKDVSLERNLGGILALYKFIRQKELPEGTEFSGVFVDRDNCLYDNIKKEFNQKVLHMIQEYEQQGKEIIIRTLGNIDIKQKILDDAGLPYKIKSKIDYKGAMLEIIIDDESSERLYANANIKAKTYIKV